MVISCTFGVGTGQDGPSIQGYAEGLGTVDLYSDAC